MAISSMKLLALVTILLAVFAQEAVEGKTHYLDWEVKPHIYLKSAVKVFSADVKFLQQSGSKVCLIISQRFVQDVFLFV